MHEKFNKTNRFLTVHTEQEVDTIIGRSVLCVDKICFPKSGHNLLGNYCHITVLKICSIFLAC